VRIHVGQVIGMEDESARLDCAMEWWFVQGRYAAEPTGQRDFMVSLFRQGKVPRDPAGADAFCLLLSVLDPATGRTVSVSQVDPAACEQFVRLARSGEAAGVDPLALGVIADELAEYGPPRPICCEAAPVELASVPLRARWEDFELEQGGGVFHVSFAEPGSGRRCCFRLTPLHPRVHLQDIAVAGTKSMDYVSYTRLALEGEVAGEPVRGEAWLDHQWGSHGRLVTGEGRKQVLGWDWLGVQLTDGRDLLVMVHRDMSDRRALCQYAVLVEAGRPARLIRKFALEPTRWWTSPATRACYPVACRVAIPELELAIEFEPTDDDQEIAVLGAIRAVWEGAGKITGTCAGRPVAGRARLELYGYALLLDARRYLGTWTRRIERRIEEYLPRVVDGAQMARYAGPPQWVHDPSAQTAVLSEPLWDLIDRGGKRWRPLFGLLLLEALGVASEPYELLTAVTMELAHTGSLVIDDIEDRAQMRRGSECIHARYGVDVAINAANTAYFLPYLLLSDYPHLADDQRLEIYRILSAQSVCSHLGQGQDIYWSRCLTSEQLDAWARDSLGPKILQSYAHKTAALVAGMAETACVIAKADAATRAACVEFARSFGVAFQIVDDILDFSRARREAGTGGRDLAEGKLTYIVARTLERLPAAERGRLRAVLCSPELRQDTRTRSEGIELVQASGAPDACRQEAHGMVNAAWARFSEQVPPSEPKTLLRALCMGLLRIDDGHRHEDAGSRT